MSKLTIVEAAEIALKMLGVPSSVKQVYAKILERSLYKFGAQDPVSVLRIQMERHCVETSWVSDAKVKRFRKSEAGLFSNIESGNHQAKTRKVQEVKLDDLTLINQLAQKLKNNTVRHIIDHLYSLEPEDFESFCQRFLERYGFENMTVTRKGRDGGIDVKGHLEVGISQLHVAAQCKRYKRGNKVSRPDISQFRGDIQGEFQQGIFVTTSEFTQEAKDIAFKRGCVPIVLIDGETLAEIMIDREIGVTKNNIPIYDFEIDRV
ncbi:restriction endonuclease [Alteromonas stellipolaris]|uniref:restriction endonuclease n=1 Tax=Alteromonas stellipolaris TaxID=233316 RepID=UPI002494B657|nr:restriction endonuclease [Alteromonas stellipolaris]